jgi:polygalacturonase
MKRQNAFRHLLATVIALFVACNATPPGAVVVAQSDERKSDADGQAAVRAWDEAAKILKRIKPPPFPKRDFGVTNYGAFGDGTVDCTKAFQDAIAACNKAGGGRVVVPSGTFLTGAIHLKSRVNLHLTKDATILFSKDPAAYLPVVFTRFECTEVMNYSPFVYAFEQENIAITGEGTLDGQANAAEWHSWKSTSGDSKKLVQMGKDNVPVKDRVFGEGHHLRPNMIQPCRCRNVLIEGVRVINSPMWVLHPLYSTNVTIRGVTVEAQGPNTDGCDPDSCTDVLIEDCSFSDGDDCIAVKSGRDEDGRRVNIPCENVVIRNCHFEAGHGGVTMGSETGGGIRNVFAENCNFDSPDLEMAMRFKTNPARGGFIESIYLRNCTVKTAQFGVHMTMRYSSSGAMEGPTIPYVRNIDIRDSKFANLTKAPIFIQGWSEAAPITDVTIANCELECTKKHATNTITNAARVRLVNVKVNGEVVE